MVRLVSDCSATLFAGMRIKRHRLGREHHLAEAALEEAAR